MRFTNLYHNVCYCSDCFVWDAAVLVNSAVHNVHAGARHVLIKNSFLKEHNPPPPLLLLRHLLM